MEIKEKFLKRVNKKGPVHPIHGQCWIWCGPMYKDGYGQVALLGEHRAHRVAYSLAFGTIPEGKQVLHRCDNRGCVNPDHLFLGTHSDNMRDMTSKGRQATGDRAGPRLYPESRKKGESNHFSKLTEREVLEIRNKFRSICTRRGGDGKFRVSTNMRYLSQEYGVCYLCIKAIIKRKTWKHV